MNSLKKVSVSCPTKFHSDYMANQLENYSLLDKLYTAHPKSRYLNRVKLNESKITFLPPIFASVYILNKISSKLQNTAKKLEYKLPFLYDWLISLKIKKTDVLIVWAWAGLKSIIKVKALGGTVILEECGSCNKFQNEILTDEYQKLGLLFKSPTPEKIVQRELQEATLADYILCPSNHVANSFIANGFDKNKCIIIPYGANTNLFKPSESVKDNFSILFIGSIGVRKGLIYLFKALELLQTNGIEINCTLIGKVENEFLPIFKQYRKLFNHIEQVPHLEIINYYHQASVFVLPSLDEGMAYVQLEAMACGLPVICTPNSGGDSVINDGKDGFIVPIRDERAIANKIEQLFKNKELLKTMSIQAHHTANQFTWDTYGKKLAEFISKI